MKLSEKQMYFGNMFVAFLVWAKMKGYEFTIAEVFRPPETQKIYLEKGVTTVEYSKHQDKLAFDIILYQNGSPLLAKTHVASYKYLGQFWKGLDARNRWGGDWSFCDPFHFEYAG